MGNIRYPRITQPQQGVGVDWSHPLAKGLVEAWIPANNLLSRSGSVLFSVQATGVAAQTNGTVYLFRNSVPSLFNLAESSITAILTPDTISNASVYAACYGSSASGNPLFMIGQGGTTNQLGFRTRDAANIDVATASTDADWANGKTAIVTGTRSAIAALQRVYINGRQIASTAVGTPAATTFDRFAIGGLLRSTFALGWAGRTGLVLVHNRALSAAEVRSLYINPWQIFAPVPQNIFVDVAAAGTSAALTGTVTTATETDIVTGGKTIILTLTGDTWVTAGATFDAQRQNIINGIDSAQAEAAGWDAVVKATQGVAGVVRTSGTVVTITLDAQASYSITANETITATIPATALTGGVQIVASPTFTVTNASSATDIIPLWQMMQPGINFYGLRV